jgi:ankyrin repeat protein
VDHGGFVQAVEAADAEAVRRALARGADPNVCDADGNPVLLLSAWHRTVSVTELLVTYGAQINVQGHQPPNVRGSGHDPWWLTLEGSTSLLACIGDSDFRILHLLLEHGADPNIADANGNTPLLEAARSCDPETVRELLRHGADPNRKMVPKTWSRSSYAQPRPTRANPLPYAVTERWPDPDDEKELLEVLRLLLEAGADPNSLTRRDLAWHAWWKLPKVVQLLRHYGRTSRP